MRTSLRNLAQRLSLIREGHPWTTVTLETSPPAFTVDIDPGIAGTTMHVPFHISEDGTLISAEMELPGGGFLIADIVGETFEFHLLPGVFGYATIRLLAVDPYLNPAEIEFTFFLGNGEPSPDTHQPLDAFTNGTITGAMAQVDPATGIEVVVVLTGATVNAEETGAISDTAITRAVVETSVRGVVSLEISTGGVAQAVETGGIAPEASGIVLIDQETGGLTDAVLTAGVITISEKSAIEQISPTGAVVVHQETGALTEDNASMAIY